MKQYFRPLIFALVCAALVACGGDEKDTSAPSFAGNYTVRLSNLEISYFGDSTDSTARSECYFGSPSEITMSQSVSQNGRDIILTTDSTLFGETTFKGGVDAGNRGFSSLYQSASLLSTMDYSKNTLEGAYSVRYTLATGVCSWVYSGVANKR